MVKVNYLNDSVLKDWYWKHISVKVKRAINSLLEKKKQKNVWISRLAKSKILCDIIFEPLDTLKKRYTWINEYLFECKNVSKCKNGDDKSNIYLQPILKYSFLDSIRAELVQRMNVKVCPYCNQAYVYTVDCNDDKQRYLGDLDHVLSKSKYSLFALSLWNLVPSCKSCNQTFKRASDKEILSPVEDGFGDDCIFRINRYKSIDAMLGNSDEFDILWDTSYTKNQAKRVKMEENIALFQLNELYAAHKQEIKLILRKRATFSSETYLHSICNMTNNVNKNLYELLEDVYESLFGEYLTEDNYTRLIHAKMTHDILLHN